jgi:uncharacterized Zn-binding protein involved in type VI secretion
MGFPAARVGDLTVTGDVILPPGAATVLIGGQAAACVGNAVAGPVINSGMGRIVTGSGRVLVGGKALAVATSAVTGLTNTGVGSPSPIATTIAKGAATVWVG